MQLVTDWVSYDGTAAYLARPGAATKPVPAVIVIQEIWGVDEHIRDVTERFATAGYLAVAPDLWSAGGGRPPALSFERLAQAKQFLNTIPPPQWGSVLGEEAGRREALAKLPAQQAAEVDETLTTLFGGRVQDTETNVGLLRAAFAYARSHPACGGLVASVGYCMGGGLSGLLACEEPELDAAAIYYGAAPPSEKVPGIRCPVRGFYGQDDPRIVAGLPEFERALSEASVDHELRIYPETGHAFFNDGRPSYRQAAARDAWARTLRFFADVLNPAPTVPLEALATG